VVDQKGPCHTFFRLDRKTYCTEFNLKMFICKGYNGGQGDDVIVVCNGWKQIRSEMTTYKT
jgi:hypothetical protein